MPISLTRIGIKKSPIPKQGTGDQYIMDQYHKNIVGKNTLHPTIYIWYKRIGIPCHPLLYTIYRISPAPLCPPAGYRKCESGGNDKAHP